VTYLTRGVPDGGDLTMSTALFISKGLPLSRSFSKLTTDYFRGETYTCPFDSPAKAAAVVNKWVSKSSGGVVKDMGVKLEAKTRLALLQTVVFGAKWQEGFDFRETERGLYQISAAEKPVHVQYMTKVGTFAFYDTDLYEAIALPYVRLGGRGPAFEAIIVLPRAHSKTTRTIEDLMARPWKGFRGLFRERVGHVRLPRVEKVETKLNFERNLDRLGFSVDRHLFSGIASGKELPLSEILHHTVFSMTEDGEQQPRPAQSLGKEHFKFYAERPYFVFVQDTKDDILLFSGLIADPRR
jgi:serine protease inhibitor